MTGPADVKTAPDDPQAATAAWESELAGQDADKRKRYIDHERLRREAKEIVDAERAEDTGAYDRLTSRCFNRDELIELPEAEPLIEKVLMAGAMSTMAGKFGSMKSFVAISWACCIATGTPWLGQYKVTAPGAIVYVAAEGSGGIRKRVNAWEEAHGLMVPADHLFTIVVPTQLKAADHREAIARIAQERNASLVVFDTLSRCIGGVDENSNSEMRVTTIVSDLIREKSGAATLFLHHTGHSAERGRGASTVEDDADVVWLASGDRHGVELTNRKLKDSDITPPINIRLELVPGTGSGHVVATQGGGVDLMGSIDLFGPQGATAAEVARVLFPSALGVKEATNKARGRLDTMIKQGVLVQAPLHPDKIKRYVINPAHRPNMRPHGVWQQDGLGDF